MSSTGTPSILEYRWATRIAPELASPEGSLAMLHEIALEMQDPNDIFRTHIVNRDETRADATTLESVVKLTWGDPSTPPKLLTEFFSLLAILVRDEYRNMLQDIIQFAYQTKQCADGDKEINMNHPSSVFNTDVLPIALGATVIGNPGIGKSVFLIYVLALRLLCHRTTMFQRTNEYYCVLNNEGVFHVKGPVDEDMDGYFPEGTWFLIDSNQNLEDVPMNIPVLASNCRGFILQATSPHTGCVQWQKKRSRIVHTLWMSSWSIAELIAGRDLQWPPPTKMFTEVAIERFCELYGTSARHVYSSAMDPAPYAKQVYSNIRKLTDEKIRDLLDKASAAEMDDVVSYYIIKIDPVPGARKQFTVKIITKHLLEQILQHLKESDKRATSKVYQSFIKVPYTRASAGYILERAFLEEFPDGGKWPITAMKKGRTRSKDTHLHWHFDESAPRKYLRLGFQPPVIQDPTIQGPVVLIDDVPTDSPGGSYGQVEQRYFAPEETSTLERRFYIPQSSSQPSFDAFVYDPNQQRATVFQVTVAKEYAVSIHGLDWLNECGANTIDLVMVMPPLGGDNQLEIGVANSHQAKLSNVYSLALV